MNEQEGRVSPANYDQHYRLKRKFVIEIEYALMDLGFPHSYLKKSESEFNVPFSAKSGEHYHYNQQYLAPTTTTSQGKKRKTILRPSIVSSVTDESPTKSKSAAFH